MHAIIERLGESSLVQRLERMEDILIKNLKMRTWPVPQVTCNPEPAEQFHQRGPDNSTPALIYLASYKLGDINLFHGVPFLSRGGQRWIVVRSEEDRLETNNYNVPGPLWLNQDHDYRPESLLRLTLTDLPPRYVLERSLEKHQSSEFADAFPLIDSSLFATTMEEAYNNPGSYEALPAKASIFAYLALAYLVGDSGDEPATSLNVERYDIACQLLIPDLFSARASSKVVDALMMMGVYQFTCGNIHRTDIIISLASKSLFMLGAHLYPGLEIDGAPSGSLNLEARKRLHRRDLFWICYTLDKEITFRTGRPPIINDTSCDLTFPVYYLNQISRGHDGRWRLPGDLRLSMIKSKAYEKLYSPQSSHNSDSDILKNIRELDNMLEVWRLSLPVRCRPTLSSFPKRASARPEDTPRNISAFVIRLEYYHCVTTIHQASSRCKNWSHKHRVEEGLRSSIDVALRSSRCQLSNLHLGEPFFIPKHFWVVLFYPMSAVLTLLSPLTRPIGGNSGVRCSNLERLLIVY
ncbi:hypothetical protein, variant 1 [Exophiala oligosperma]|uniref:Xylanolytic transcriptional activator regulatory domain-containing protein n=1 Tax=Exophiala oligosperma TaxID=215243 RepID=A0A0D2BEH3_9EURO|nr:hypothetical protein, variant 1 [Exophiala oligosperma]KIW35897.1 hypothetical protein, variant 1 [Exophiala oligosperma]